MDKETLERLLRSSQQDDDGDADQPLVSSIWDANCLLQQHMNPNGARFRRKLVQYITDPSHAVRSEGVAIHNFIMDLFRVKDYDLAIQVCDYALQSAPYHRDILADALDACAHSSQFERGEQYFERAMEIPKKLWSDRLFLYASEFLNLKLTAFPMDEALFALALQITEEHIHIFPYEEHGYNQRAELRLIMNQRDTAIAELNTFIFDTQPDEKDKASELIAAQCCVTLLNLLDNSNQYDQIIRICDCGLRYTTQEQPSARIGFFVYRKALALDAKAHAEGLRIPETITAALRFYQSAYDLNQDRSYAATIEQRYAVLRPHAENPQPLLRRALYVQEAPNTQNK